MIYDSVDKVTVLYGGGSGDQSQLFGDTWIFNMTSNEWTDVTPAQSPSIRYASAMAYNPTNNETVLFGGFNNQQEIWYGDTWVFTYVPATTPTTSPSTKSTPTTTSTLPSPNLSFACISSTTSSGFNVQIQGSLTYNGVGLSGAGIQLSDSVTGGATWQDLTYVNTDNNGNFTCVWNPPVSGNYAIEATWSGDNDFAVAPFNNQNQNVFSVTSNSTLTSLTFDSTTDELSFGVSGPSGTTGVTEVCIPQSLIPDASKVNVTLDGAPINYNTVSEDNVWLLTFAYHHSSHIVVIALESTSTNVSEFPTIAVLAIILALSFLAVIMLTVRKRKKSIVFKG
jgi:hypothetical protein